MAGVGAEGSMLEAELSCPVCLSTYRDPVSLGCGHCFCRQCISEALSHQKDQGRPYTCPMCQEHYQDFPALKKNLQLSSIVESFVSMQKNTEHAQIPCGDCLDQPSPAVKTCVSCEVSLCHKHLERHANRGHVLLEPTASVQDRKCAEHDKLLEYYCEQDAQCICVTCYIAGAHKGHNIMTLKQAHEKKLATLSSTTSALSNIVSTFCKDIEDLNAGLVKITENTIKLSKPLEDLCEKIILQVRGQFKKITQAILINQEETTSKMTATIKQIEDAKATTEKALDEINLISKQPDDLLFVKDFSRSQSLIKQQSPRVNMMQVVDVEADKVMIENIDKETTDYIVIIGRHLAYTHDVLSQQIEQLVWSGSQRKKVENQKAAPRVKLQKSEKMSLSFTFNCTQCSHTGEISNLSKTITAKNILNPDIFPHYPLHVQKRCVRRSHDQYGNFNTSSCNCKLSVISSVCIPINTSSKVHCLVDVSMSNDWCVGVTDATPNFNRYLQWKGNRLSYESNTSFSLGIVKINRLKMKLDLNTNLLGFYDAGNETEIPILICKCDVVFTNILFVGFKVLDGSLTLI